MRVREVRLEEPGEAFEMELLFIPHLEGSAKGTRNLCHSWINWASPGTGKARAALGMVTESLARLTSHPRPFVSFFLRRRVDFFAPSVSVSLSCWAWF